MAGAENPLLVFISSIMDKQVEDLSEERDAAVATIDSLPITRSWAFEYSPASADTADETYLDRVDDCDIFLLILGEELTDPVEKEYARAASLEKRRLVFAKNVEQRSPRAAAWLDERRQEVKYDRFQGSEDLSDRVRAAVVDEVIKAHRKLHLGEKDFAQLALELRSEPITFMVRTIEARELKTVTETLPDLKSIYPGFDTWVDDKAVQINDGSASAYVATYGQENAGFALVTDKEPGVRKLSTLYIQPRYQGLGVGPRLLYGVIGQAARDRIGKLYLTVSEERREQLEGLLLQFGFFVEGVSGRRYRDGSWEWVWSKRLIHGRLSPKQLEKFSVKYLLEERGLVVDRVRRGLYGVYPRYGPIGRPVVAEDKILLVAVSSGEPDQEYRRSCNVSEDMGCRLLFVSVEPVNIEPRAGDICFDSLDLEAMFFPMYVEREVEGLIIPIRETFVRRLIPPSEQSQFLAPTRVQLRTDNVYYRYPNVYAGLERGSPLFFYETQRQGQSRLIGEAKLLQYAVDLPEDLLAEFGRLGVYTLEDLKKATNPRGSDKGKALALRFDWYREIENPLTLQQIKQVLPTFDPRTARRITPGDVIELRRLAGWDVRPLSLR